MLIAEQGQATQRIDENVEEALTSTQAGMAELQRYWAGVSGNRGLIMRIFAVLMFFVVMFGATF